MSNLFRNLLLSLAIAMAASNALVAHATVTPETLATIQQVFKIRAADFVAISNGCGRTGAQCTFGSDCCDNNCNANHVCGTDAFCKGNGGACTFDSDCCSNICNNGACSLTGNGSCLATGSRCTFSTDCCDNSCNANGVCGQSAFCNGDNDSCTFNSDCCSNYCNNNHCS